MNTPLEQNQQTPDNQAPLTPLADFRKSGRAPVEMHHLIFHHKESLVEHGAICKVEFNLADCFSILYPLN